MIHIIKQEGFIYQNIYVNSSLVFNRNSKMGRYCFWARYRGRIVQLLESLSFTYTANDKRQIQVENFSKYKMSR